MSHRDHAHRFSETDAPVVKSDQANKSIIDMASPDAVRAVFNHSARRNDAGSELSFDSPYATDDWSPRHHHSKKDGELRHILRQLAPILQDLLDELDPSSTGGISHRKHCGSGNDQGNNHGNDRADRGSNSPQSSEVGSVDLNTLIINPETGQPWYQYSNPYDGPSTSTQGSDSTYTPPATDGNQDYVSAYTPPVVSTGNDTASSDPSMDLDVDHTKGINSFPDVNSEFFNQTFTNGQTSLDVAHIKGVNLSGGEWGGDNNWPTTQEVRDYAAKGFNTIRLAMSWEKLQPQLGGPPDQNELRHLDEILRTAAELGIKVMPEMHNYDRYEVNHAPGDNGAAQTNSGTLVGDQGLPVSALSDLWTKVVRHVNSDPTLSSAIAGWDLMNEPYNTNGTWASTALAVDQAIRATGDNHTVIVEGDNWGRDFNGLEQLNKIDPNIAFQAHSYWDANGSGNYGSGSYDPNIGVNAIQDFENWLAANDAQGFIGEFGVPVNDPNWDIPVTNFIKETAAHGLGNIVWAGGPSWGGNPLSVEPNNGVNPHMLNTIIAANETYL